MQQTATLMEMESVHACTRCEKPPELCVCAGIMALENRVQVVILRHPQEQDHLLGTARIAQLQLKNSVLKTGLSWRNLAAVLGGGADPKQWGVLYLGSAKTADFSKDAPLTVISKNGVPWPDQAARLAGLKGIIALDGNWQQAKALWWRNAWLLKCQRLILRPPRPSFYGALRKEPRRESVATLEAIAYTLAALADDAKLAEAILAPFQLLLKKAGSSGRCGKTANERLRQG